MSIVIPSAPDDKKAIKTALAQISTELSAIGVAKDQVNEIIKAIEEKYGIPAKIFRKVAYMSHKATLVQHLDETTDIEEFLKQLNAP